MASKPLRVLFVEDNERDVELLLRELRRGGYEPEFERVETADDLKSALGKRSWSIVLSDWRMPEFEAPAALALVKELAPDLPFIIVSGTIGEDTAVDAMRAGAHDFMTKDKLARLIPAVERELSEASVQRERRKLQEQLVISDRMASVGTLAAGVAHEINNPLAALMANLDFAVQDLQRLVDDALTQPTDDSWRGWLARRVDEVVEPLRDARESSERVRHIVRDLKIFSRSSDEERHGPVEVRRVLESSLRMAWNEIRHRASLVKDYGNVPPVQANESRLGQVFLNLIVNAAQAIPEGRAEKNEIRIRTGMADGQRVLVEVHDTGTGIAPEHISRLFDAFFTTKPVGVGTGLGLSICHRIITSLGGEIAVQSEIGSGSTFRLLLPIAKQAEPEPVVVPRAAQPSRRGRILVVDDEPMVSSAVRRMLASDHEVVTVARAEEALERLVAGEHFDVIICDLMMPHMTGMDLHAELSRSLPETARRLVFMTGGAFTTNAREFLDKISNPRLEKPFDVASVRFVVHSLLR
ncbi:MAG: response regulator [Deltaproteobacteria bacterium]|nr:response regulator [Deltaproteobacteria bacterium]